MIKINFELTIFFGSGLQNQRPETKILRENWVKKLLQYKDNFKTLELLEVNQISENSYFSDDSCFTAFSDIFSCKINISEPEVVEFLDRFTTERSMPPGFNNCKIRFKASLSLILSLIFNIERRVETSDYIDFINGFPKLSFGSLVGGKHFVKHYSTKFDEKLEMKFVHFKKEMYILLASKEIHDRKYAMEIRYKSIKTILVSNVNQETTEPLEVFLCLDHPPIFKCLSETFDRCAEFGSLAGEDFKNVIGRCLTLKLQLRRHSPQMKKAPTDSDPLNLLFNLSQFSGCPVDFGFVDTISDLKEGTIRSPNDATFSLHYALQSIQSVSWQFYDELKLYKTLSEFESLLRDCVAEDEASSEPISQKAAEGALFKLYTMMEHCVPLFSLLDIYKIIYQEKKNAFKIMAHNPLANEEKSRLVWSVVLTPSRMLICPYSYVPISKLVYESQPGQLMRLSLRDEDFSLFESVGNRAQKRYRNHADFGRNFNGNQRENEVERDEEGFLVRCFLKMLSNGIRIGNKKFEYVGSSKSQLLELSMWLYASDEFGRTAVDLREKLGSVSDTLTLGKYICRVSQALSSPIAVLDLEAAGILDQLIFDEIPDIENDAGYNFTDGIGEVSVKLADLMMEVLRKDGDTDPFVSKVFQIRFRGCKGLLVVNEELSGYTINYRKSMKKIDSPNDKLLYILNRAAKKPVYLNQPLISLLNHHGVENSLFVKLQQSELLKLFRARMSSKDALSLLTTHTRLGDYVNINLIRKSGLNIVQQQFFKHCIGVGLHKSLKLLKTKARVPLSENKARLMLGICDRTRTLKEEQIYAWPSDIDKPLSGRLIVTKNPMAHPGDVRIFTAVDVPELHGIRDCVAFSICGTRPDPDKMAGSDLDGDEYVLIWDERFMIKEDYPPADYQDENEGEKDEKTNYNLLRYFLRNAKGFSIGIAAKLHLQWSDALGPSDPKCLGLAKKYTQMLDQMKTGAKVVLNDDERCHVAPDFVQKYDHKPTYRSKKALGVMYRNCCLFELAMNFDALSHSWNTTDSAFQRPTTNCDETTKLQELTYWVHPNWTQYKNQAEVAYRKYRHIVEYLMDEYCYQSEFELLTGYSMSEVARVKINPHKEKIHTVSIYNKLVRYLEDDFEKEYFGTNSMEMNEKLKCKACAYYMVTIEQNQLPKLSYYGLPWIGKIGEWLAAARTDYYKKELGNGIVMNKHADDDIRIYENFLNTIFGHDSPVIDAGSNNFIQDVRLLGEKVSDCVMNWFDEEVKFGTKIFCYTTSNELMKKFVYEAFDLVFLNEYARMNRDRLLNENNDRKLTFGRLMILLLNRMSEHFLENEYLEEELEKSSSAYFTSLISIAWLNKIQDHSMKHESCSLREWIARQPQECQVVQVDNELVDKWRANEKAARDEFREKTGIDTVYFNYDPINSFVCHLTVFGSKWSINRLLMHPDIVELGYNRIRRRRGRFANHDSFIRRNQFNLYDI